MHHPTIVLISGKHPLTAKSGYARYAAALARNLTKLRYDVHIFCVGTHTSTTRTSVGTIHVVKIPLINLFSGREMITLLPASIRLAGTVRDFIHKKETSLIWGIGPWSLAGAWIKEKHPSTKFFADYFTTIHHEYRLLPPTIESILAKLSLIPIYSLLEWYTLRQSNVIITHYRSTETILRKEFSIRPSKFYRTPYAIDLAGMPKRHAAGTPLLLTICRQDYRKGIPYLLEAYAILNRRHIPFRAVIVGGGHELVKNKLLAHELKLTSITFTGFVEDIKPYMNSAYCFVLPSLEEGSGSIAVLEAMAAGLPIIATNIDGIPEDIENGISGILVPPGNPYALADAIEKIVTTPRLARRLGCSAYDQYMNKYHSEKVTKALRKIVMAEAL